jgi:hypothetical protein
MRSKGVDMQRRSWCAAVLLMLTIPPLAIADEPMPLDVLYLARDRDEDRSLAFEQLLSRRFRSCRVQQREDFQPQHLDGVEVVVLDWSQSERSGQAVSPIGPLDQWTTPTVLLGSAGLLMADAWQIIGDAG